MTDNARFRPLPRGHHRLSREEALAIYRERLVQTMVATVTEHGYDAASIGEISSRARVTRPAFYEAFPEGKQECFLYAYRRLIDRAKAALSCEDRTRSTQSRIAMAGQELAKLMLSHPRETDFCMVELLALGARGSQQRDETIEEFADQLLPNEICQVPRARTHAVIGGCYHVLFTHVVRRRLDDIPGLVPSMTHAVLQLLHGSRCAT